MDEVMEMLHDIVEELRGIKSALGEKAADPNELLSGCQAAKELGVTGPVITKMRQNGRIEARVVGKRWMYPRHEINRIKGL